MSVSRRTIGLGVGIAATLWLAVAYALAPWAWRHYEHQRGLADRPMITTTRLGIPGDALNVGLEGEEADVICAMRAAGWNPADPVTLRSSARIVGDVLARRAYPTAPVSDLLYQGRRQDLAFQKPSGVSPSRRHHVRFWKALDKGDDGAPVWLGAATYDTSVGFSHYTGQVTHHVAPDIDAERDLLASDLAHSGHVAATYTVSGVGPTLFARNGGGDRYFTDGEIAISRLRAGCESETGMPAALQNSPGVEAKNAAFGWMARVWRDVR
jgi:hypothetical protein